MVLKDIEIKNEKKLLQKKIMGVIFQPMFVGA